MILFYPIFHCSLSSFFLPVWYFVCSCVCLPSYWSILHSFLLILFLSPFFFQWSPVSWSLRASVYVYFSEPSSESSFHSFPPSVLLFKLYALWFSLFVFTLVLNSVHFYYNLSFYLQFYCDNYFSLFSLLIMEKMPAFILVILQLAFVNWWMKSMIWIAIFKNFTRDKLGMEALTQPYFYKTVHSPLWLGLSLFFTFLLSN